MCLHLSLALPCALLKPHVAAEDLPALCLQLIGDAGPGPLLAQDMVVMPFLAP
jgi:hypothetical protein